MRPYYDEGGITLYLGDSREVLPQIEQADLVLTDPPYGVGKAEWDEAFPLWWFNEAARIAPVLGVMPGTSNILNCPREIGRLAYKWTLAAYLVNGMTRGVFGFANWIPCLVYAAEGVKLYCQNGDITRIVVGREPMPNHPSPKPLDAMRWFVARLPGQTILDPFAGSGTTLVAAKQLGRKAIGIEVNEQYAEIAARRLSQGVLALTPP
jgi:site-specific DNA-methyltransferase (adenine-specific)